MNVNSEVYYNTRFGKFPGWFSTFLQISAEWKFQAFFWEAMHIFRNVLR